MVSTQEATATVRASSPAETLATYAGFDLFLRLGVAPRRDVIATCTIRAQIMPCARLHCTRQLYHGVACGLWYAVMASVYYRTLGLHPRVL